MPASGSDTSCSPVSVREQACRSHLLPSNAFCPPRTCPPEVRLPTFPPSPSTSQLTHSIRRDRDLLQLPRRRLFHLHRAEHLLQQAHRRDPQTHPGPQLRHHHQRRRHPRPRDHPAGPVAGGAAGVRPRHSQGVHPADRRRWLGADLLVLCKSLHFDHPTPNSGIPANGCFPVQKMEWKSVKGKKMIASGGA